MAKPNHNTLVTKLVEHYSHDVDTATAYGLLRQFKAAYEELMPHAPMDWLFFLRGATTDQNVQIHLQRTLNAYFGIRGYDWLLAQYKHIKTSTVA
jgi:hypothetical protein